MVLPILTTRSESSRFRLSTGRNSRGIYGAQPQRPRKKLVGKEFSLSLAQELVAT
jgi:hypothetical protein